MAQKGVTATRKGSGGEKKQPREESGKSGYAALIAGWLIPGGGHFLTRKWIRGTIILVTITTMFILGLLMRGKLYPPTASNLLDLLGFLGDLGAGLLYFIGHIAGAGSAPVQVVTADYGAKFVVVAGLLNFIAAVDAHNIAIGRKK